MHFSILDWGIIAVYLAVVFFFGLRGQKSVKNSADYLVAGRNMGLYAGAISLLATEIGIITYMYYAEMGFLYGFTSFLAGVIGCGVYLILGKSGFVIRKFRERELTTISELFETSYGRDIRILAGILMAIGGALNFGVFPIIEATFLNILTGIPQQYIIYTMAILLLSVLVYTALGGMVSVIITNYVQYVVLVLGMILITVYCFLSVSVGDMISSVQNRMGPAGFDPFAHPAFGWKFIFWQTLAWFASLTAWAPVAARTFSSESPKVSKSIFTWTGFLFLGRAMLPFIWGIAALAYLGTRTVPAIQAMPLMLREILPMGIVGLVVAGMLAASMSTYSGYLLAWSSVICEDVVIPLVRRPLRDRTRMMLNQGTVLFLTLFIIGWGLFYIIPGATYFYLQMTANIFLAGTFWAIVGALYWKHAHRLGAYCALIFGGSSTLLYFVVADPVGWSGTIGLLSYSLSFFGMVAGSLIGTFVPQTSRRLAILFGLITIVGATWFAEFGRSGRDIWVHIWLLVFIVSAALFVILSVRCVVGGWEDVKRVMHPEPVLEPLPSEAGKAKSDIEV
jgi:SSS family solute:Na+ symporter